MKKCLSCLVTLASVMAAPLAFADDTGTSTTDATGTQANTNANATTEAKATDVLEDKGQSYYFLGVNYRMNIVPAFIINLFVDEGPNTVLTSTVGISADIRKDHFSIIPGINFTEYGMDPVL